MTVATSDYATKQDVQEIVTAAVDKAVADLSEVIANFAQQADDRFNKVEYEIVGLKADVAELKTDAAELKASQNRLLNTIDGFIARLDRQDQEQLARDNQFQRLLEWARKVSEKTGIPLENL